MADVSCRLAHAADSVEMAGIQLAAWQLDGPLPVELVAGLDPVAVATSWREAIVNPPTPSHRVVVALHERHVVGFLAWGPAGDPDLADAAAGSVVEVVALVVDPGHRRSGHGSRLLAAWAEMAGGSGAIAATMWLPAVDEATRAFLLSAGWGPDGASRSLTDPETHDAPTLTLVRLATSLS